MMSGTIFFICLTSAILAHFTGLGISAGQAALKRWRDGCKKKGEKRIVAKSKPTVNLAFTVSTYKLFDCAKSDCVHAATSSSSAQCPIASKPCQPVWKSTGRPVAREHNQDAADAVLDVGSRRLVAAEKDQELQNFHEDRKSTRKLVASGNSETEGSDKVWPHNLHMSTDCVLRMEKFSRLENKDMVSV